MTFDENGWIAYTTRNICEHQSGYIHNNLLLGSGSTSNDLNQFASNDSLSGTVEQNLELVDHVTSVLRSVVHGVTAGRLLAGVAFSKSLWLCQYGSTRMGSSTKDVPSRESWQERIPSYCRAQTRQSRRRRSWLFPC